MHATRKACFALALLLCALPGRAAVAPTGRELPISSATRQQHPSAAYMGSRAVIAWEDVTGVVMRAYDPAGRAVSAATQLAANDPLPEVPFLIVRKEQHEPVIAVRGNGFVAAWVEQTIHYRSDFFYERRDLLASSVMVRLFDGNGTAQVRSWQVAGGDGVVSRPAIVAQGNGYWVVWQQVGGSTPGIHLSRLDDHAKPGLEVAVSSGGVRPALAAADNRLLVAWQQCCGTAPVKNEVFARLIDLDGTPHGSPFVVSTGGVHSEQPAVVAGNGGEFLVASQRSPDGRHAHVYGQLVSSQGAFLGHEITLSSGTGDHGSPHLAAIPGGYLATWSLWFGTFPSAVVGAAFDGLGNARGDAFRISQGRLMGPYTPALAAGPGGKLLAVWEGRDESKQLALRGRALQAEP
ncbi:MAG TPA: hypothetical protein VGV61_03855 [Thermoanaerobaculia bacterium]|jgi:hypothetical protein|nr:hypothetical protein [Thermoanaerobaculia bacterium]